MSNFTDVPDLKKSPVLIIGLSLFCLVLVGGFVGEMINNHQYDLLTKLIILALILLVVIIGTKYLRRHMDEGQKERTETLFWSLAKSNRYRAGPVWIIGVIIVLSIYYLFTYVHFF